MSTATSCVIPVDTTINTTLLQASQDIVSSLPTAAETEARVLERIRTLIDRSTPSIQRNKGVTPGVLIDLTEARDLAMHHAIVAPIPGCEIFGVLSQHLGYVVDRVRGC